MPEFRAGSPEQVSFLQDLVEAGLLVPHRGRRRLRPRRRVRARPSGVRRARDPRRGAGVARADVLPADVPARAA